MIRFVLPILALAVAIPAHAQQAKNPNQSPFLPSREQSMINRIQAGVTSESSETGKYGVFDHDCSEADVSDKYNQGQPAPSSAVTATNGTLKIGANNNLPPPKEQIIVARDIVNVGGQCRMRR
jgi:hypothetical protein